MTRRSRKKPVIRSVWTAWDEGLHRELFRLAAAGWTPPAKVRLSAGRAHITASARFRMENGNAATARVKLRRVDGDKLEVTDEGLSVAIDGRVRA